MKCKVKEVVKIKTTELKEFFLEFLDDYPKVFTVILIISALGAIHSNKQEASKTSYNGVLNSIFLDPNY